MLLHASLHHSGVRGGPDQDREQERGWQAKPPAPPGLKLDQLWWRKRFRLCSAMFIFEQTVAHFHTASFFHQITIPVITKTASSRLESDAIMRDGHPNTSPV
jgi:hypothetical protein